MAKQAGPRTRHIPLRKCIATGEALPKSAMIRIVRTPEGGFEVDNARGRQNGRGAYIKPDVQAFELALKKKALQRTFGGAISADQLDHIKEGFIKRLLEMDSSSNE